MVLAQRRELDAIEHDHAVVRDVAERTRKDRARVLSFRFATTVAFIDASA